MVKQKPRSSGIEKVALIALLVWLIAGAGVEAAMAAAESSELSDEAIPIQEVPERPGGLIEIGTPFLDTGPLGEGIELPTGAVWQPQILVFGTFRTALQAFDVGTPGDSRTVEWVNRLDLFAQIALTGTERVLIGVRPLDREGRFSGIREDPDTGMGRTRMTVNERNFEITTAFFEGDFGEVFPNLDPDDSSRLDYGFAIGRQPLFFQEGFLLNDVVDSIGITRNNAEFLGSRNTRITYLYGWNDIHRNDNREDESARLAGVLTEHDFSAATVNLDFVFVESDRVPDAWFAGISTIQRLGHLNTAFRITGSKASGEDTPQVSSGTLLFSEISWTPAKSNDLVYWDFFVAIDRFSSAARGPATGGPLGRTGILFASPGIGSLGSPLPNDANEAVGAAIGYQLFFNDTRTQLILEIAGRTDTDDTQREASAVGFRLQQALGRRFVLVFDAFGAEQKTLDNAWGVRIELLIKI